MKRSRERAASQETERKRKTKGKVDAVTADIRIHTLFVAGAMGKMTGEDDATGVVTRPTAQRAQLSRHGFVVGPVRSLEGQRWCQHVASHSHSCCHNI